MTWRRALVRPDPRATARWCWARSRRATCSTSPSTAEASGAFDAVWVGDSLLAKPRLEAVTLLSALAGVTSRVRLGVGCMATFVHRHPVMLAHQWASLDVLSDGRVVAGRVSRRARRAERRRRRSSTRSMGVQASERVGAAGGGHRHPPQALRREERVARGPLLQFDGRDARSRSPCSSRARSGSRATRPASRGRAGPARPSAVVERGVPARRALRRRLDDQQAQPRRVPPASGRASRRWRARRGAIPRRSAARSTTTSTSTRTAQARARGDARSSSTPTTRRTSARRSSRAGRSPAARGSAWSSSARTSTRALGHMALRLTSWDQRGQLKRFLTEVAPALLR